jgi:hypothetical protein
VRTDPMVLRRTVAVEAVEQAVVEGITRHGEDFVLVVEPARDSDGDGVPDSPVRVIEHRADGGDRRAQDVGSPVPDRAGR